MKFEAIIADPMTVCSGVAGMLKSAIDAHGPITKQNVGSAAKRVACQIRGHLLDCDVGATIQAIIDTKVKEVEQALEREKERNAPLKKSNKHLVGLLDTLVPNWRDLP